jgi:hypothetical protein
VRHAAKSFEAAKLQKCQYCENCYCGDHHPEHMYRERRDLEDRDYRERRDREDRERRDREDREQRERRDKDRQLVTTRDAITYILLIVLVLVVILPHRVHSTYSDCHTNRYQSDNDSDNQ